MQCVRLVEVKDLDLGLSTSNRLHFCKVVPDSLITRVFFFFFFFWGGGWGGVGLWEFMVEGRCRTVMVLNKNRGRAACECGRRTNTTTKTILHLILKQRIDFTANQKLKQVVVIM
jgi:hypothetical protein